MLSWRSAEVAHNMKTNTPALANRGPELPSPEIPGTAVDQATISALEARLGPVAYKLENEQGEVDLRRLTGDEAMVFMGAMGIPMGRTVA